jgi:acetyl esterase
MLDPQARALLDLMIAKAVPSMHTLAPPQARSAYRDRRSFTQPDVPPVAQVQDLLAPPALGSAQPIAIRSYRPLGSQAGQVLPALVYYHGGGWVIGDLDTHDVLCRQLCNASGCAVLAVDYRLAPEQPFPAAFDDAVAAARWVHAQADNLHIDPQRIALGGDSAGGNLAAAACLHLRDLRDTPEALQPAFQLLIYPATDLRCVHASHQENGQGYLLTREVIEYYVRHYAHAQQRPDWRASPLLASSYAKLPPALVLTAGFDPLVDEGAAYADALSQAGVPTQYVNFPRQIHGFITMGRVITEANTAVQLCASVLRAALA